MASSGWQGQKDFPYNSNEIKCDLNITGITHSGTNLRVQGQIGATGVNMSPGWYAWYDYPVYVTPPSGSQQQLLAGGEYVYQGSTKTVNFDVTIPNVSASATSYAFGVYVYMDNGVHTGTLTWTIYFDASTTPPSGGSITNVSVTSDSISATCSLTSWGSTTSNAFKRLCVLETGHYITTVGEPQYVDEKVSTALSTTHTVDNNSATFNNPSWTIQPNTSYNLGIYASTSDGGYRYDYPSNPVTTLATAATVSVGSVTGTTATINYSTSADGGALSKEIQYSLDGGTTWVTGATVSTGSASSGTFTISGLSGYTTYSVETRVHTTAGDAVGATLSVTTDTIPPDTPTVSVATNNTYNSLNVAWGTASFGAPNTGTAYIYSGTSASPTQLQYTKTTTGTSLWTNTGLAANKRYYYRARAKNSADLWSSYSSDSSAVTLARPANVSIASTTDTSITVNYSTYADGGEYDKDIQYSIDGGTTWVTGDTVTGGSVATGTFTISGLTAHTSYTIRTRVSTTAGTNNGSTLSAIATNAKLYGSVNSETKWVRKLYGSLELLQSFTETEDSHTGSISGVFNATTFVSKLMSTNRSLLVRGLVDFSTCKIKVLRTMLGMLTISYYDDTTSPVTNIEFALGISDAEARTYGVDMIGTGTILYTVSNDVYAPVSIKIKKLYGSVNSQTKLIFEG